MNKWLNKYIGLLSDFFHKKCIHCSFIKHKTAPGRQSSVFNRLYSRICNLPGLSKAQNKILHITAATDTGKIRQNNEDNFFVDSPENCAGQSGEFLTDCENRHIFAVCDGMGGEAFGEEASRIAVAVLAEFADKIRNADISELGILINQYAAEANNRICDMISEKLCRTGGSTIAMVCTDKNYVYVFNIGDSRVYYFNNGVLTQITEDQTLAVKKLKANIYTQQEAKESPDAHKITSFLGVDNRRLGLTAKSYEPFSIDNGIILICSDGLTDMCSDDEIAEILAASAENPAAALIDRALCNGGKDNVTCIVIKASDPPKKK